MITMTMFFQSYFVSIRISFSRFYSVRLSRFIHCNGGYGSEDKALPSPVKVIFRALLTTMLMQEELLVSKRVA